MFNFSSPKIYYLAFAIFVGALAFDYYYFSPSKSSTALSKPLSSEENAQQLYGFYCLRCHGDQLQGQLGPNLVDSYWIQGDSSVSSITQRISDGNLQKAMPAWKKTLSPAEINDLALWISSQQGKEVSRAKAPEGSYVEPTREP